VSNYTALRSIIKNFSGQDNVVTIPKMYIEVTGDLTAALVLNQVVFWSDKSKRTDGFFYKSYKEWQEETTLTERQVRYAVNKLKEKKIVETKLKKANGAPTLHYKLEYDTLLEWILTLCQNGNLQNVGMETNTLSESLTENTTEKTTENTTDEKDNVTGVPSIPYSEIVDYLNSKCGTKYKSSSKKTQNLIKARFNEGFTLDDFKTVIDKKSSDWFNDNKMNQYLRPETLFGTKFESYLNQKGEKPIGSIKQDYAGYNFDRERELSF
jgi:uncharacterized phage protein (TIGR02220 family)